MKLNINPKSLAAAAATLQHVVRHDKQSKLMLIAKDNQLKIFTSSNDLEVTTKIPADVLEEGSVVTWSERFIKYLNASQSSASIALETFTGVNPNACTVLEKLRIRHQGEINKGTGIFAVADPVKRVFEESQNKEQRVYFSVDGKELYQMLQTILPSGTTSPSGRSTNSSGSSSSSNGVVFNVVLFELTEDHRLKIVTTDTSSLSEGFIPVSNVRNETNRQAKILFDFGRVVDCVMPILKTGLKNAGPNSELLVNFVFGIDRVHMQVDIYSLAMMGVHSKFIDYARAIPKAGSTAPIVMNTQEFRDALNRLCLVSDAKSGVWGDIVETEISFTDQTMILKTSNCEEQVTFLNELPAELNGAPLDLQHSEYYLNAQLLKALLDPLLSETLTMGFQRTAESAYRIDPEHQNSMHILMPVKPMAIKGVGTEDVKTKKKK